VCLLDIGGKEKYIGYKCSQSFPIYFTHEPTTDHYEIDPSEISSKTSRILHLKHAFLRPHHPHPCRPHQALVSSDVYPKGTSGRSEALEPYLNLTALLFSNIYADFTSTANVTGTPCGNVISSTPNAGSTNGEYIVRQAQAICGSTHLNYCNRVEKKVLGTVSGALLAGTIPGTDDLVVQCLPLDMLLHDGVVLPLWEISGGFEWLC
jgi:hypothetical protein